MKKQILNKIKEFKIYIPLILSIIFGIFCAIGIIGLFRQILKILLLFGEMFITFAMGYYCLEFYNDYIKEKRNKTLKNKKL